MDSGGRQNTTGKHRYPNAGIYPNRQIGRSKTVEDSDNLQQTWNSQKEAEAEEEELNTRDVVEAYQRAKDRIDKLNIKSLIVASTTVD